LTKTVKNFIQSRIQKVILHPRMLNKITDNPNLQRLLERALMGYLLTLHQLNKKFFAIQSCLVEV